MASAISCEAADFCSEFAGEIDVSFLRVYQGNPRSRVIVNRDGLVLVADMSPLVVGHMLLLPTEHFLSFATLAHERLQEVNRTLARLRAIYLETFGQFAILEHGSSGELAQNACITHAHWHIVPLSAAQLCRIIVGDGLIPVILSRLSELARPPWSRNSYFYVSDGDRHVLFQPTASQPKQYLRSVMGGSWQSVTPNGTTPLWSARNFSGKPCG